jgi:fatty acid-binding protein DegV
VLNICPLLNVDYLGRLQPREKIRGKKKVIARTLEMMEKHAEGGLDYSGKCYISYSACLDDALKLASMIEERFPKLAEQVQIYPIGATIGSHTGPGTVALFFWGDERED